MAGFFYFVPGEKKDDWCDPRVGRINQSKVDEYELGSILGDCGEVPDETVLAATAGPDGREGVLIYPRPTQGDLPRIVYNPETQTWVKFKGLWVGWLNKEKPTSEDIMKRETCLGYVANDAYGRPWSVPIVVSSNDRQVTMPQRYGYDSDGNFVLTRRAEDQPIFDLAGRVADVMDGVDDCEMNEQEVAEAAIAFLAVNYRVSPAEIFAFDRMGTPVLDRKFVAFVFSSVTDFGKVNEFKKKEDESDHDIAGDSVEPSLGATG